MRCFLKIFGVALGEMVLKTWFCGIKVVKTTNNGVEMCVE